MKQTAVEWLFQELNDYYNLKSTKSKREILKQAKEMFEQQVIDANRDGADMVLVNMTFITGEQYYNETFNK